MEDSGDAPGAAVVTGNQNHVRMRLGHARRDRADADFGDQLHADARVAVGIFQIVNQLRQIFDGVNVMMRRRRNQADAGRRAARFGDVRKTFLPGNSPPSPGFAPCAILICSSFASSNNCWSRRNVPRRPA
jgi:hypothetical protein